MAGEKTTRPNNQNVAAHLPQAFAQSHDTVPTVTTNAPYNVALELCPDGPQNTLRFANPPRRLCHARRTWPFLRDSPFCALFPLPSVTLAELPARSSRVVLPLLALSLSASPMDRSRLALLPLFKRFSDVGMAGLT